MTQRRSRKRAPGNIGSTGDGLTQLIERQYDIARLIKEATARRQHAVARFLAQCWLALDVKIKLIAV